jgi:hypothetical protein
LTTTFHDRPSGDRQRPLFSTPSWSALLIVLGGWAAVHYLQLWTNEPSFPLFRSRFAFDFQPYYDAARLWRRGVNPYSLRGTPTPPLSLLVAMPLSWLRFEHASAVNALLSTLVVGVSLALCLGSVSLPGGWARSWPLFLLVALSYPFAFLVSTGNVEYWVWLSIAAGVWFESRGRSPVLSGSCFGLGAVFKLYPLVFVAPLVALRRYKTALLVAGLFAAGQLLPYTGSFYTYFLTSRMARPLKLYDNASVIGLARYAFGHAGIHSPTVATSVALAVYGLLLGGCIVFDWLRFRSARPTGWDAATSLALYVPFIAAVPQVAYCYVLMGLALAVPALDGLWSEARTPRLSRRGVSLFAVGVGLAFAPVYSASYALHGHFEFIGGSFVLISPYEFVHALPPAGNLLCMIGATLIKSPDRSRLGPP